MYKLSGLNIYDIHSLQVAEFVYAYNNGLLPAVFSNYFCLNRSIHSHYMRVSNDLHCMFARTNTCARSIRIESQKLWNSLPNKFKQCSSKFIFKKRVKGFFLAIYLK